MRIFKSNTNNNNTSKDLKPKQHREAFTKVDK